METEVARIDRVLEGVRSILDDPLWISGSIEDNVIMMDHIVDRRSNRSPFDGARIAATNVQSASAPAVHGVSS